MGYTTYFDKEFTVTIDTSGTQQPIGLFANCDIECIADYINSLSATRRMIRDLSVIADDMGMVNGVPINDFGVDGEFFTDAYRPHYGEHKDITIIDYNRPPSTQPSLWNQWVMRLNPDDTYSLMWNQAEKFYHYVEWLEYMLATIFVPNNLLVNGVVYACGADYTEKFVLTVVNNILTVSEYTFDGTNDAFFEMDEEEEFC